MKATTFSFLGACLLSVSSAAVGATVQQLQVQADGRTWTYHLHVPSKATPSGAPLVVVFHGAGGNGRDYLTKNGWATLSEQEGFVVVAPDGLAAIPRLPTNFRLNPRLWNSGQLNANSPRGKINDIAFVNALLDDVALRTSIDTKRVYATGHSNGAGMTFKVGAELSERFAGLATVMGLNSSEGARPTKALPTLMLLGTRDPLNPIEGGERELPWGKGTVPPVAQGIQAWKQSLGCTAAAAKDRDDEQATVERFSECRDGATFTVWYFQGQGHAWPGGQESGLPESVMGPNTTRIQATPLIWQFFSGLPR
ncbi:alpha/beta hydrolase family esterase [Rhodoferax sp.]|uniref:alpha/beta hydrolase family esterase n=1 Tax=Rhodoferax sp. TaxID=50421 RepID=UPI003783683A